MIQIVFAGNLSRVCIRVCKNFSILLRWQFQSAAALFDSAAPVAPGQLHPSVTKAAFLGLQELVDVPGLQPDYEIHLVLSVGHRVLVGRPSCSLVCIGRSEA